MLETTVENADVLTFRTRTATFPRPRSSVASQTGNRLVGPHSPALKLRMTWVLTHTPTVVHLGR